jgi:hypothetical protein
MRIAIDIDSTLHHYWDLLAAAARRRFGVDLPYDEQLTWRITRLRDEQLLACVEETHGDEVIAAGRPYPGAVETVNRWGSEGHFIHIMSQRHPRARQATERWLGDIGLRHDDLYCSFDKIARCTEIGIDVLIDDSPLNILRAIDSGLRPAAIRHPWNRDVCEGQGVLCAADWPGLARVLDPVLTPDRDAA